jgi:hypothetical protein
METDFCQFDSKPQFAAADATKQTLERASKVWEEV